MTYVGPHADVDAGDRTINWDGEPGALAFAPNLLVRLGVLISTEDQNFVMTSVELRPSYTDEQSIKITMRGQDAAGEIERRYLMVGKGIVEL